MELLELSNEMSRAETDRQRESIGIAGLNRSLFTTAYVVQLAKLFQNENVRLAFVNAAYTRVVDPENYFQLTSLFTHPENVKLLESHMEQNVNRVQQRQSESGRLF